MRGKATFEELGLPIYKTLADDDRDSLLWKLSKLKAEKEALIRHVESTLPPWQTFNLKSWMLSFPDLAPFAFVLFWGSVLALWNIYFEASPESVDQPSYQQGRRMLQPVNITKSLEITPNPPEVNDPSPEKCGDDDEEIPGTECPSKGDSTDDNRQTEDLNDPPPSPVDPQQKKSSLAGAENIGLSGLEPETTEPESDVLPITP